MYWFSQAVSEEEKIVAFSLRYQVYCKEKKWLDYRNYPDEKENDEYDHHSVIFLARNSEERVVGTARLIINEENNHSLPITRHPSISNDFPVGNCTEISRFTIALSERSGVVNIGLIRMLFRYIIEHCSAYEKVFFCVEPRFLYAVNRLGFKFEPAGKAAYWFGDCIIPSQQTVRSMNKSVENRNPLFHRWLWQNISYADENDKMMYFIRESNVSNCQCVKESEAALAFV